MQIWQTLNNFQTFCSSREVQLPSLLFLFSRNMFPPNLVEACTKQVLSPLRLFLYSHKLYSHQHLTVKLVLKVSTVCCLTFYANVTLYVSVEYSKVKMNFVATPVK